MDPQLAFVDAALGTRLQRVFHRYPSVRACYDTLCEHVFAHDLRGVGAPDQAAFKQLGADVLRHALCFGVCVVQQRRGELPVVLPWGSYQLAVKLDARRRLEYHVFDLDEYERELPDTLVLANFQSSPTPDGGFTSAMHAVRLRTLTVAQLQDCMLTAARMRAMPPVLLEQDHDSASAARDVEYEFFADADAVERSEHSTYVRDKFALKRLERMVGRAQDALEGGAEAGNMAAAAASIEGHAHDDGRGANVNAALRSVCPVPHGFKVSARGLGSAAPENYLDCVRFMEMEVFRYVCSPRAPRACRADVPCLCLFAREASSACRARSSRTTWCVPPTRTRSVSICCRRCSAGRACWRPG